MDSYKNMNSEEVTAKVKEIKQKFRFYMNGEASRSMRLKGLDYKVNWGISLQHLRLMAEQYGHDRDLAVALWDCNVRECRLLATLVMPTDDCDEAMARHMVETSANQEVAEMLTFNLLQRLPFAMHLSSELLSSGARQAVLCAFLTLTRLAMRGQMLVGDAFMPFAQKAVDALRSDDVALRHAALNCVARYLEADAKETNLLKDQLKKYNLDIF